MSDTVHKLAEMGMFDEARSETRHLRKHRKAKLALEVVRRGYGRDDEEEIFHVAAAVLMRYLKDDDPETSKTHTKP